MSEMKSFKSDVMSSMAKVLTFAAALLATACLEINAVPDKDEICAEGYQFDEESEKCVLSSESIAKKCGEQASYNSETQSCECHGSGVFDEKTLTCTCNAGFNYEIVRCPRSFDANGDEIESGICAYGLGTVFTYQTHGDCEDIDECHVEEVSIQPTYLCGDPARNSCINTKGSYRCECGAGYEPATGDDGKPTCVATSNICDNTPGACTDQPHTHCVPNDDSYSCECDSGYDRGTGMFASQTCNDIDECSRNAEICGTNATCKNTEGSYICTCQDGSTVEGAACPENACNSDPCSTLPNSHCVPIGDTYRCDCNSGYEPASGLFGAQCNDIDECSQSADFCGSESSCENTAGSFICTCQNEHEPLPEGERCPD